MKSHRMLQLYPTAPLSPQLFKFIDNYNDFEASLKLSTYPRFVFLPRLILSYPPNFDDEVIGMFYWDNFEKIFKQDFIVNVSFMNKSFISYSRISDGIHETDRVKGLDVFFKKYGKWDGQKGEFYCRKNHIRPWMHHYKAINELPNDIILRCWAEKARKGLYPVESE